MRMSRSPRRLSTEQTEKYPPGRPLCDTPMSLMLIRTLGGQDADSVDQVCVGARHRTHRPRRQRTHQNGQPNRAPGMTYLCDSLGFAAADNVYTAEPVRPPPIDLVRRRGYDIEDLARERTVRGHFVTEVRAAQNLSAADRELVLLV